MAHCVSKKMKYGGSVKKMEKGGSATPTVLPKPKPKTSTNKKTGATRGAGDDKEYMRKAAAANMESGGEAVGRTTTEITSSLMDAMRELEKSGKTLKPSRPKNLMPTPEQKKKMKDKKFIRDGIIMMEEGGSVPKQYKGFSKLPEDVQMKMDPAAARKYEGGGEVRGMGRAYQGKPRGCKIR
jgi:hypothetical protein